MKQFVTISETLIIILMFRLVSCRKLERVGTNCAQQGKGADCNIGEVGGGDDSVQTIQTAKFEIFDESCNGTVAGTERNIWEFDNNHDALGNASIYKREIRFPSYVGYPCNVGLYLEYKEKFYSKLLSCPFEKGLDERFQKFVNESLWTKNQTTSKAENPYAPRFGNNTLLFQYICFSAQQNEECVPAPNRAKLKGSCDGECRCIDTIPLKAYTNGLIEPEKHPPKQILELGVRCGVKVGGACIPRWSVDCPKNEDLENKHKPKDFYLQCESNAGCHPHKFVCECAQGHQCSDKGSRLEIGRWMIECNLAIIFLMLFYVKN